HAAVFPRLLTRAQVLAAQLPMKTSEPAQRWIRELAASKTWQRRFTAPVVDWHCHEAGFYYDALAGSASRVDLWETEYVHVLNGPEAVADWYRATGLRPFLNAL